jgi:hypothetical protein
MDSELDPLLQEIRNLPLDKLKTTYQTTIPADLAPSISFWESYTQEKLAIGLRACLMIWVASRNKCVETHFIYLAGLGLYGLPAFRPAWGRLGEFRVKLRKGVVFQALPRVCEVESELSKPQL